jgi:hypothetical protein
MRWTKMVERCRLSPMLMYGFCECCIKMMVFWIGKDKKCPKEKEEREREWSKTDGGTLVE